ncbi:MAG: tetratricopeptide repeat protein [Planctomycetes bacterium]|nr:tetratricopeptide repeat protein [Planctomycetota bacterium]
MPSADEWNQQGIQNAQSGRLADAVACFQQAIALHPALAQAHNNLGIALQDLRRHAEAIAAYQQAVSLLPHYANALLNLASAYHETQQPQQALDCYRRILEFEPPSIKVLARIAEIHREQGRHDDLQATYRDMVRLPPRSDHDCTNLGIAWLELGDPHHAIQELQRALSVNPNLAAAHSNLGIAWQRAGQLDNAIRAYRQALTLQPSLADAHSNLGAALWRLGQIESALSHFQTAIQLNPRAADAYLNLGHIAQEQLRLADAIACYRQAVALRPQAASGHAALGQAWRVTGQLTEAIAAYQSAVNLEPDNSEYLVDLIHTRQLAADWRGIEDQTRRAIELVRTRIEQGRSDCVRPFSFLVLPLATTGAQQLQVTRHFTNEHFLAHTQIGQSRVRPAVRTPGRIRVGYLSVDFREHPVGASLVQLFELHNRERFEITAYSYGVDDGSPTRQRISRAAEHFVDLRNWSHSQAADRIAADDIDILVDLTGYTSHSRTEILALRPAPLQVSYWGYAGTMGASFIDSILVDNFIAPAASHPDFAEKLWPLPGCYLPHDTARPIASTPTRAACGLPADGFVFCCFNNGAKITPAIFSVWMKLLQAVPGSVLWLLEGKAPLADNLRKEAEARGVSGQRLVFAPRAPRPEYLAQHRCADLFLDTPVYNSHTSACDALYAGLPLLTVAGATFASRVAGSLLTTLGLTELITHDLDEYLALALSLANDRARLDQLRHKLYTARESSPFFAPQHLTQKLEAAFAAMLNQIP